MKYGVKTDGIHSRVEEINVLAVAVGLSEFRLCQGCTVDGGTHRTWFAAQRCLIRWLEQRAMSFRDAAKSCREEMHARKGQ